jgi:IS30 family transposase
MYSQINLVNINRRNFSDYFSLSSPYQNAENQLMDIEVLKVEGITITQMAKALGIPRHTVETRLIRAGIKPFTYEALYPSDTLEKIKDVPPRGRPKKTKEQESESNAPKNPHAPSK